MFAWGSNSNGQLGNDTFVDSNTPVDARVSSVTAISAGGRHSLALFGLGLMSAWGFNGQGQLGDGTTLGSARPVIVRDPSGDGALTGITAISAGARSSIALK